MKHSSTWFALILIASASLLSGALSANDLQPPKPEQNETLTKVQKAEAYSDTAQAQPQASAINPQPSGLMREAATQQEHQRADHVRPEATIAELVMVGITAAYVLVAFFTLRAIKRQADIAERALKDLERPWMNINLLSLTNGPSGNQPTTTVVTFNFLNSGRSPAWITSSWLGFARFEIQNLPQEPIYPVAQVDHSHVNVAPGATTPEYPIGAQLTADEALAIALRPKERTLMLYGYVNYRDVFGREHCTRFCYFYHPPASIKIPIMPMPGSLQMGGPPAYNQQT